MQRLIKKRKYLYLILLIILIFSFLNKGNYKNIGDLNENTFKEPIQEAILSKNKINIKGNSYDYTLSPIFDYEITGLVVSKYDYGKFKFIENSDLFTTDLCIVYGDIIKSGIFKNEDLTFYNSSRFCYFKGSYDLWGKINLKEITNNHITVISPDIKNKLDNINPGDQVQISGKLVNIQGKANKKLTHGVSENFTWLTSITREDTGAGACETIFIEDLKIIKKGHPILSVLYDISFWGIIALLILEVFIFFSDFKTKKEFIQNQELLSGKNKTYN